MGNNVTIFGDVSDAYDEQVAEAKRVLDAFVEDQDYAVWAMASASVTIAFMEFAKGFTDVGRLGNGTRDGGWGYGQDALRLAVVVGPALRAVGFVGTRVLQVRQAAGTMTCTWVSTTNAVRMSGHRYFLPLKELAKRAKVPLAKIAKDGTSTAMGIGGANAGTVTFGHLGRALKSLKIPHQWLSVPSSLEAFVQTVSKSPRSVFMFSVEYGQGANTYGHSMRAALQNGKVVLIDTTGKIYASIAELKAVYTNARPVGNVLEIQQSILIRTAKAGSDAAATLQIAVEVLPPKAEVTPKETVPERPYFGHHF